MKRETGGGDNPHQPTQPLFIRHPLTLTEFASISPFVSPILDEKTLAQGGKVTCLRPHNGRIVHSDPLWTWLLSQGWGW